MNAAGKIFAIAAAVAALTTSAFASPDHPADQAATQAGPRGPSILVASEDFDADTIPRGNVNFNRIQRAIIDHMAGRGFKIYDETAITMDRLPQGRVRRELPELLQTAKLAQAPIDVIVVFQIHASIQNVQYVKNTKVPHIRVDGRMIRVRGGQDLTGFEYGEDVDLDPIPQACFTGDQIDRQCLLESVGTQARPFGAAVGDALAIKLASFLRANLDPGVSVPEDSYAATGHRGPCNELDGTPYVLRIRDFNAPELQRLEEAFTSFACYQHYKVMKQVPSLTEYWYESRADQARIVRDLQFVMQYMNVPGSVSVTSGNVIILEKHILPPHGVDVPR